MSREKFNSLKVGIKLQSNEYNLESLINECENNWNEPEWGFPKGRRNFQEKDLTCALREFEEETGEVRSAAIFQIQCDRAPSPSARRNRPA